VRRAVELELNVYRTSFNPRTREGCDESSRPPSLGQSGFNPRTREGCDAVYYIAVAAVSVVSIHAPARGATFLRVGPLDCNVGFNPRTREGCDPGGHMKCLWPWVFQSTHPRGVRPWRIDGTLREFPFQSTHPRGVRQFLVEHEAKLRRFQSTHPRGVRRLKLMPNLSPPPVFQSTHPRGVRQSSTSSTPSLTGFQSTHPRGVRLNAAGALVEAPSVSIHAPARGATEYANMMGSMLQFQSTHPRGVRLLELEMA